MSFETKAKAQAFGRKIKKELTGKGWKAHVWNNMGWHVEWKLGRFVLHYSKYSETFSALIGDEDKAPGSPGIWARSYSHKDPNTVVKSELKYAMRIAKNLLKGLTDVECMLAGKPVPEEVEEEGPPAIFLVDTAVCNNCERIFAVPEDNDFATIPDLNERVLPGEMMPITTCPSCEALAYPTKAYFENNQ